MKLKDKITKKRKTILITGGAGYIGTTLIQKLPENCIVYVVDNYHIDTKYKRQINKALVKSHKVTFIKANVGEVRKYKKILSEIDTVIYMASLNSVTESELKPEMYLQENNLNLQIFLTALSKYAPNVKKIILTSTRGVYGEGEYRCLDCKKRVTPDTAELLICPNCDSSKIKPIKTREKSRIAPGSHYGLSKRIQEDLISLYCLKKDIELDVFRIFNIFGNEQEKFYSHIGIIPMIFNTIKTNKEVTLAGKGEIYRDFIDVNDACDVLVKSIYRQNKGIKTTHIFNLGSGNAVSVLDICKFFKKKGYQFKIKYNPLFSDIKYSIADNSNLRKEFNIKKFRSLHGYLDSYYKHN